MKGDGNITECKQEMKNGDRSPCTSKSPEIAAEISLSARVMSSKTENKESRHRKSQSLGAILSINPTKEKSKRNNNTKNQTETNTIEKQILVYLNNDKKNLKHLKGRGLTILHLAVLSENIDLLQEVLQTRHDLIHEQPKVGEFHLSPLDCGVLTNNIDVFLILLRYGAYSRDMHNLYLRYKNKDYVNYEIFKNRLIKIGSILNKIPKYHGNIQIPQLEENFVKFVWKSLVKIHNAFFYFFVNTVATKDKFSDDIYSFFTGQFILTPDEDTYNNKANKTPYTDEEAYCLTSDIKSAILKSKNKLKYNILDIRDSYGNNFLRAFFGAGIKSKSLVGNTYLANYYHNKKCLSFVKNLGHTDKKWLENYFLDSVRENGDTILHIAAATAVSPQKMKIITAVLEILSNQSVELNSKNSEGKTALHIACENKNHALAIKLLQLGADPNRVDMGNETPLHILCKGEGFGKYNPCICRNEIEGKEFRTLNGDQKRLLTILTLLEKGAITNIKNKEGKTALHLAATTKDGTPSKASIVKLLVEYGADQTIQDNERNLPIHLALKTDMNHEKMITYLLDGKQGASILSMQNNEGKTPLHIACEKNAFILVVKILDSGATPNIVNAENETPLHILCKGKGFRKSIEQADVKGKKIEELDNTDQQRFLAISTLLEKGTNTKFKNKEGKTALHMAATTEPDASSKASIVKLLIERGADQLIQDEKGNTPLHLAIMTDNGKDDETVIRHLIEGLSNASIVSIQNNDDKDIEMLANEMLLQSKKSKSVTLTLIKERLPQLLKHSLIDLEAEQIFLKQRLKSLENNVTRLDSEFKSKIDKTVNEAIKKRLTGGEFQTAFLNANGHFFNQHWLKAHKDLSGMSFNVLIKHMKIDKVVEDLKNEVAQSFRVTRENVQEQVQLLLQSDKFHEKLHGDDQLKRVMKKLAGSIGFENITTHNKFLKEAHVVLPKLRGLVPFTDVLAKQGHELLVMNNQNFYLSRQPASHQVFFNFLSGELRALYIAAFMGDLGIFKRNERVSEQVLKRINALFFNIVFGMISAGIGNAPFGVSLVAPIVLSVGQLASEEIVDRFIISAYFDEQFKRGNSNIIDSFSSENFSETKMFRDIAFFFVLFLRDQLDRLLVTSARKLAKDIREVIQKAFEDESFFSLSTDDKGYFYKLILNKLTSPYYRNFRGRLDSLYDKYLPEWPSDLPVSFYKGGNEAIFESAIVSIKQESTGSTQQKSQTTSIDNQKSINMFKEWWCKEHRKARWDERSIFLRTGFCTWQQDAKGKWIRRYWRRKNEPMPWERTPRPDKYNYTLTWKYGFLNIPFEVFKQCFGDKINHPDINEGWEEITPASKMEHEYTGFPKLPPKLSNNKRPESLTEKCTKHVSKAVSSVFRMGSEEVKSLGVLGNPKGRLHELTFAESTKQKPETPMPIDRSKIDPRQQEIQESFARGLSKEPMTPKDAACSNAPSSSPHSHLTAEVNLYRSRRSLNIHGLNGKSKKECDSCIKLNVAFQNIVSLVEKLQLANKSLEFEMALLKQFMTSMSDSLENLSRNQGKFSTDISEGLLRIGCESNLKGYNDINSLIENEEEQNIEQDYIGVSGYRNHCGLYAFALAINIALKSADYVTKDYFRKKNFPQLTAKDVEAKRDADIKKLNRISQVLKGSLKRALLKDKQFIEIQKIKYLERFTAEVINFFLDSSNSVQTDMEGFRMANPKFFMRDSEYLKYIVNFKCSSIDEPPLTVNSKELRESIKKLKNRIKSSLKNQDFGNQQIEQTYFEALFKQIIPSQVITIRHLRTIQILFHVVWNQISGVDGSEYQREIMKNNFANWFYEKIYDYLGDEKDENFKLHLSECGNLLKDQEGFSSKDALRNAKELWIRYQIHKNWEGIYNNYVNYVCNQAVCLSVDELGVLAQFWEIGLVMYGGGFNGERLDSLNKPKFIIQLVNITENHWEVFLGHSSAKKAGSPSLSMRLFSSNETPLEKEGKGKEKVSDEEANSNDNVPTIGGTNP